MRYADLDVQFDVEEVMEIWSTRPDQVSAMEKSETNPIEMEAKCAADQLMAALERGEINLDEEADAAWSSLPPDGDWPPPLTCLSRVRCAADRGLRFVTPLPEASDQRFVIGSSYDDELKRAFGSNGLVARLVDYSSRRINNDPATAAAARAPKARWELKDILD